MVNSFKRIRTKRRFYELAMQGAFGNVPRMWWTVNDFTADGCPVEFITVRCLRPNNPLLKPYVHRDKLGKTISHLGLHAGEYIINEGFPDVDRVVQGELSYVNGVLTFYHTFSGDYMRAALAKGGKHAYGWQAKELLRKYATPSETECVLDILDEYSCGGIYETCIEITLHNGRVPFGIYPGSGLIVWEVRQY